MPIIICAFKEMKYLISVNTVVHRTDKGVFWCSYSILSTYLSGVEHDCAQKTITFAHSAETAILFIRSVINDHK